MALSCVRRKGGHLDRESRATKRGCTAAPSTRPPTARIGPAAAAHGPVAEAPKRTAPAPAPMAAGVGGRGGVGAEPSDVAALSSTDFSPLTNIHRAAVLARRFWPSIGGGL